MGVISNGTTLLDAGALTGGIATGSLILLSTQTASASATISFTTGIDDTYDSYVFKFINIHPATASSKFTFQADTGTNTNYNQAITSTAFQAYHTEGDSGAALAYEGGNDQPQGTAFQPLSVEVGADADQSAVGKLTIFDPSSSTFVKHFISTINSYTPTPNTQNDFIAGYFNTTTAITRFQFKMSSGNIDSGIIKLYGVA
jgi:hypothetical protein